MKGVWSCRRRDFILSAPLRQPAYKSFGGHVLLFACPVSTRRLRSWPKRRGRNSGSKNATTSFGIVLVRRDESHACQRVKGVGGTGLAVSGEGPSLPSCVYCSASSRFRYCFFPRPVSFSGGAAYGGILIYEGPDNLMNPSATGRICSCGQRRERETTGACSSQGLCKRASQDSISGQRRVRLAVSVCEMGSGAPLAV